MKITRIKAQKNKKRVNIYLDGKFGFGLDADNFLKASLRVGQKLTEKQVDELVFKNEFQKLLNRALRLISRRPRSKKEVHDYLRRKKSPPELIEKVIKKLKQLKQVNDLEFARWWVEQRSTFRPRGKFGLTMELRQKGVDKTVIEKAINKVDELSLATKLAQKKMRAYFRSEKTWKEDKEAFSLRKDGSCGLSVRRGRHKNLPREERYQKMSAFLARRGFSWEIIKKVVAKFLKE